MRADFVGPSVVAMVEAIDRVHREAARAHDARHLVEHPIDVVEVLEHGVADDDVDGPVGDASTAEVDLHVAEPLVVDPARIARGEAPQVERVHAREDLAGGARNRRMGRAGERTAEQRGQCAHRGERRSDVVQIDREPAARAGEQQAEHTSQRVEPTAAEVEAGRAAEFRQVRRGDVGVPAEVGEMDQRGPRTETVAARLACLDLGGENAEQARGDRGLGEDPGADPLGQLERQRVGRVVEAGVVWPAEVPGWRRL